MVESISYLTPLHESRSAAGFPDYDWAENDNRLAEPVALR